MDFNNPTLFDLTASLFRIVNFLVIAAGLVFAGVVAYGAIKAAMALGNPRGLDAAKQTWTYGLYGFLIVVGYISIYTIITRLLGNGPLHGGFLGAINDGLNALVGVMNP